MWSQDDLPFPKYFIPASFCQQITKKDRFQVRVNKTFCYQVKLNENLQLRGRVDKRFLCYLSACRNGKLNSWATHQLHSGSGGGDILSLEAVGSGPEGV